MAAAASASSPSEGTASTTNISSPRSGRSNRRHHHVPVTRAVVQGDPEVAVTPPADPSDPPQQKQPPAASDDAGPGPDFGGNAAPEASSPSNRGKKQAWRRPANGSVDSGPVVMGAAAWPALSESAKASPKSTMAPPAAFDPPKPLSDGPVSNSDVSSAPSNVTVARQRSFKRGGGGNSSAGDGPPNGAGPQQIFAPVSSNATMNKPTDQSQQDRAGKNTSNGEHGSRGGGGGGDHHKGFRRGHHGGGSHHHENYGSRRDQERAGYDRYHRGREVLMQPHGTRPLIRPPPPVMPQFGPPAPLVHPPFGNPVVYPDMPSPVIYVAPPPESYRGFPLAPHPPVPPFAFLPAIDTQRAMLLKQIDYYFSAENLCRDIFLRQNMDDQGWVPLSLIAGFNRVKQLTDNMQYILDTVRFSTIVELQGEKIRRHNDWMNWVLAPTNSQFPSVSGSPATPDADNLAYQLQVVGFGESSEQNIEMPPSHSLAVKRSASDNIDKHLNVVGDLNQGGNE